MTLRRPISAFGQELESKDLILKEIVRNDSYQTSVEEIKSIYSSHRLDQSKAYILVNYLKDDLMGCTILVNKVYVETSNWEGNRGAKTTLVPVDLNNDYAVYTKCGINEMGIFFDGNVSEQRVEQFERAVAILPNGTVVRPYRSRISNITMKSTYFKL